ncbi:MAG: hypothetical protein LZF61_01255 [Nitrosomonas sp.]|nr:MAG: hypothetical protein LZF61_01255 [Nitrosomonas sp.]
MKISKNAVKGIGCGKIWSHSKSAYQPERSISPSAIGILFTGYYFGWRFLYIVHSKRTVRKYEKVLNIKVTEYFEPTGQLSHRPAGLVAADKHSNFWRCVSGDIQIPNRKLITDGPQTL